MPAKLGKLALVLLVVLFIFALFKMSGNNAYQDLDVSAAQELIEEGEVLLIDVREPYEFEAGHIAGAELLPLGQLRDDYQQLDSAQKILLVCRSGNRSGQAASFLVEQGFDEVYNLAGGMLAWQREK